MGVPKSGLVWRGKTLLQNAVEILQEAGFSVQIVTDRQIPLEDLGLPVVFDQIPGAGPLGGIYSALKSTESEFAYVLACDLPLVPSFLFRALAELGRDFDVIVPRDGQGQIHPLAARYSRRCLPESERLLQRGRAVQGLMIAQGLNVLELDTGKLDIEDRCFLNVNTPAEFRRLEMT